MSVRRNKHLLLGGMGFVGGAFGSLLADQVPSLQGGSFPALVGVVAAWGAIFSAGILVGLTWGLEIYAGRRWLSGPKVKSALLSGLLAGAIASGAAQAVFTVHRFSNPFAQLLFQSGCWGLAGGILGWRLSRAIPNLG